MGILKILFLLTFVHLKIKLKNKVVLVRPLLYALLKKKPKNKKIKWIKVIKKYSKV